MADEDIGALPVGTDDRLVGMVTDRDIAVRAVGGGKTIDDCSVEDVMSGGVLYCFEDADCTEVADNMAEKQVRRLPVVNADKKLVGMVALADLARVGLAERAAEGISESTAAARA
jgi:CBS domain-containing protein